MGPELFTTLRLIFHSLLLTAAISLVLSWASVLAFMRPLVEAVSKLRFLGLTGLVIPFTLWTGGGYDLKVMTSSPQAARDLVAAGSTLARRMLAHPYPIISACTGPAVAKGAFILLSSDYRVGPDGPHRTCPWLRTPRP